MTDAISPGLAMALAGLNEAPAEVEIPPAPPPKPLTEHGRKIKAAWAAGRYKGVADKNRAHNSGKWANGDYDHLREWSQERKESHAAKMRAAWARRKAAQGE